MNTKVKSTVVALLVTAALSQGLAAGQAQAANQALVSKAPVAMRSYQLVYRFRPLYMHRHGPVVQRQRFVYMITHWLPKFVHRIVAY